RPPFDRGPHLRDPAHVLVPEGEGERAERLERERIVCGDRSQVAPADPAERRLDAHPVGSGQRGRLYLVEAQAAQRSQSKRRVAPWGPPRAQLAVVPAMKPGAAQVPESSYDKQAYGRRPLGGRGPIVERF